jgi:hypothetical protein
MPRHELGPDGHFRRSGLPWVPVGVNYWPASCGVRMWQAWPADEIRADLDCIRELGLDGLRCFLLWPDFEPRRGVYLDQMFDRLTCLLAWCAERDLAVIPTLFTGFMSGGYFWPADKTEPDLFSSPSWRDACTAFAGRAAGALAPYADALLAVDHGNELACTPDARHAGPADLRAWSAAVSAAISAELPGVTVMSGLDQNQVTGEAGWRFDTQPGCTCLSMHGYPVSGWWPLAFDGMGDPLCRELLPLATAIARAHGPVMLQEFGTIATGAADRQRAYLAAVLPAARAAGANGFLWWCLRDILATGHPYDRCGMEGLLGLVDAGRRPRPGPDGFLAFIRNLPAAAAAGPARACLYWPRHVHERDEPGNPGNAPGRHFRGLATTATGLRLAGVPYRVATADRLPPADLPLLVAGSSLTGDEQRRLLAWVGTGGRLLWQGLDHATLGPEALALLGAGVADLRAAVPSAIDLFGRRWTLGAMRRDLAVELAPVGATVLARDGRGLPQVLRHSVGRGTVVAVVADQGEQFAREPADRAARGPWGAWVAGLLELLG